MRKFLKKILIYFFWISELILLISLYFARNIADFRNQLLTILMAIVFMIFPAGLKYADKKFEIFYLLGLGYAISIIMCIFLSVFGIIKTKTSTDISQILFYILFLFLMVNIISFAKRNKQ